MLYLLHISQNSFYHLSIRVNVGIISRLTWRQWAVYNDVLQRCRPVLYTFIHESAHATEDIPLESKHDLDRNVFFWECTCYRGYPPGVKTRLGQKFMFLRVHLLQRIIPLVLKHDLDRNLYFWECACYRGCPPVLKTWLWQKFIFLRVHMLQGMSPWCKNATWTEIYISESAHATEDVPLFLRRDFDRNLYFWECTCYRGCPPGVKTRLWQKFIFLRVHMLQRMPPCS